MAANGISTLTISSGSTITEDFSPAHSNTEIVPPGSAIWSLNYSPLGLGVTNNVSYKLYVTSLGIGSAITLTSYYGDFSVPAGKFLYDTYGASLGIIKGNTTIDNYMAKAAAVNGSLSSTIINAATYRGTWNAFSNTPTLTDGVGTIGDAYDTTVDGTGGAFPAYGEQDWRIYDGSVWQRVAKTTTTQWTIKPAGGGAADKEARQIAKLDIAQLKRRGYTLNADGTIASSVTPATTPSAQNIEGSNGANAFFFRPNNSTYAQIVAGWTVVGQPTWVVTSATSDPGDQYSTAVTITGGTFVSGQSYAFTGNIVTAGAPDTGAPFYRVNNIYDVAQLPTQYSGDVVVDNPNTGGLLRGRPWNPDTIITVIEEGLVLNLDARNLNSWSREPGEDTWYDLSGNNNHATVYGGIAYGEALGGALAFDGSNEQYAQCVPGVYFTSAGYTIQSWVYIISVPNWNRIIDFGSNAGSDNVLLSATFGLTGNPTLWTGPVPGETYVVSTVQLLANTGWHHVCATWNPIGTVGKVFIDGVMTGTGNMGAPVVGVRANCYIGRSNWGNPPDPNFNGGIGAIQIYSRTLSDAEITQNYNTTKSYYGL